MWPSVAQCGQPPYQGSPPHCHAKPACPTATPNQLAQPPSQTSLPNRQAKPACPTAKPNQFAQLSSQTVVLRGCTKPAPQLHRPTLRTLRAAALPLAHIVGARHVLHTHRTQCAGISHIAHAPCTPGVHPPHFERAPAPLPSRPAARRPSQRR
eukprot:360284-Chlamydomonas_euryale.AAC.6